MFGEAFSIVTILKSCYKAGDSTLLVLEEKLLTKYKIKRSQTSVYAEGLSRIIVHRDVSRNFQWF